MDGIAKADSALFTINNVWMLVSTILVFIMHLGFASLEVGLTRAKNTVNISKSSEHFAGGENSH